MRQNREDTRKEGAWTCWRSVLFGTPTDAELDHAVIMEAHQIRRFWEWGEEGRESSRDLALLSTRRADVEVVAQLLIQPDGYEIVRAALAEEPEFRPTVLAAIEKWCKWIEFPRRLPVADRGNAGDAKMTWMVECAPGAGQIQAAVLTICRAWLSSNWAGLR